MKGHFRSIITSCALIALTLNGAAAAEAAPQQKIDARICDQAADFFLGVEDYSEAIRLHLAVLSKSPDDELAHYHLGFAYGMLGRKDDEIREYERAVALGLRIFDLYINLGLAYVERGELVGATRAFQTAASLTDFPGLTLISPSPTNVARKLRRPNPKSARRWPERHNGPTISMCSPALAPEKGDIVGACYIWSSILSDHPGYEPAVANLRLLQQVHHEAPKRLNAQRPQGIVYADAR